MRSITSQRSEGSPRRASRSGVVRWIATATALAVLAVASPAVADEEHEDTYAGHPLRIVAYVLHPIGVILDTLIFRPFHWLGNHEPFSTLNGHED
jgi:hypothetical protein